MKYPEVTSLYKYRGFNEFSLQSLIDEMAWFSKPGLFNDPFDCGVYVDSRKMEESINTVKTNSYKAIGQSIEDIPEQAFEIKRKDKEAFELFRKGTYEAIQKLGIYSLSSIKTDILMWGHYADSHKGFCIEYERSFDNFLGLEAEPVVYKKKIPSLSAKDFDKESDSYLKLILTKSRHWSYEKEWRILRIEGNRSYKFPCKIRSIIFGLKMSRRNRLTIRKIFKNRNIQFKEAIKDEYEYSIKIVNENQSKPL